jgi:hypothetical protein
VLSITDPESLSLADGSLLRADLMLRSGQFEKALTLYRGVRGRFDPIREQVDTFLTEVTDPPSITTGGRGESVVRSKPAGRYRRWW